MHKTNNIRILLIAIVLSSFVYGCRGLRELKPSAPELSSAQMALMEMQNNQPTFDWMSTRFSGSVLWDGKTHSIAGSMRIRSDSAIYISIAPILGIEIARAIITPDSVKLINRLESTYYSGNMKILSARYKADVDYYMLQALLTGNDFPHYQNNDFLMVDDPVFIKLHSPERLPNERTGASIDQTLSIDPAILRIRTNVMKQNNSDRALRADYRKFDDLNGKMMPSDLKLMFMDGGEMSHIELTLSRTTLDVPQNMQFSVPSRYTPIRLTD